MNDLTIESLPEREREAIQRHVEWLTIELGDRESAEMLAIQVLIKLGPQL